MLFIITLSVEINGQGSIRLKLLSELVREKPCEALRGPLQVQAVSSRAAYTISRLQYFLLEMDPKISRLPMSNCELELGHHCESSRQPV